GPGFAVANPLNIPLSGFLAKLVTRAYHLYAIPRNANRWAVALDGEVSNSTGAAEFTEHHPERYFEMFIAEQQLVASSVGLH
ncbi:hypothetical protein PXH80_33920, partial [Mycolicibacterium smegmatis]|uniref:hypothetical protein n=1 Tax=Mycolicibacterium smegmatis TaxID=1772 RepID=UPI0023DB6804